MHGAVNKYGLDPAVLNMLYFDAWKGGQDLETRKRPPALKPERKGNDK